MDPTRPYDPANDAQTAVVKGVEQRMDEVTKDGRLPRFHREKVYGLTAIAGDSVLMAAPLALLAPLAVELVGDAALTPIAPFANALGTRVQAGADFLRVLSVQLDGWAVSVDGALEVDAAGYALALNPHARRSVFAPVVFDGPGDGGHRLDCFPAATDPAADTNTVRVVRRQRPEAVAAASPTLYDAVLWAGAGAVLEAEKYGARAAVAQARAASVLTALASGAVPAGTA